MDRIEEALHLLHRWKPTRLEFGDGVIAKAGATVRPFGNDCLIVLGSGSIRAGGVLDRIAESLAGAGVACDICEGVEANPSEATVYRIACRLLSRPFQCVLAVGGGSVMDAAKAACILASARAGDLTDYYGAGRVSPRLRRILPLVLAPTTSGSGSFSMRAKVKRSVSRHGMIQRTKAFRAASLMAMNPAATSAAVPNAAQPHCRCFALGTAWVKS